MKRTVKLCFLIGIFPLLIGQLHAGSRPVEIGFVDATSGERTKEGKRLFELFVQDAREIFLTDKHYKGFPWEDGGTVRVLPADSVKGLFKRMLITDKHKQLASVAQKHAVQDGIVVFEYDKVGKKARLKVFSHAGRETLLLRLDLADEGAMKMSVYKDVRRGAVIALGTSVKFVP